MREYILTEREREILKAFIEKDIKLNGFSVLAIRLKRASQKLLKDWELIKNALEKMEKQEARK